MPRKRKLSCIVCPMGCSLEVTTDAGQVKSVTGNTCPRGVRYAREEITAPKRTLTTTVRVAGGELPLLPVISHSPLPKDTIIACARRLSSVVVKAPVHEGDIICRNILNLGVDIQASRDLNAKP